ncbi:hypothetical protein [Pontibacter ruber]|uniref:Uncharacterized protein n=1 Tax=Pontibacter ruber TaxID=1343895 RepID=A0ABW5D147_9BACT|nr:hypothetical protein [Pontibacter ruber]
MKDWKSIKEELYYEDGSLRDIYVFDTNKEDWKSWSSLVNEQYEVEFYNGRIRKTEEIIDIKEVYKFWKNPDEFTDSNHATIKLGNVIVKCYFFIESEIENDIDPKEVKTERDHLAVIEYLQAVATKLHKNVVMTPEMTEEHILLKI